MPAPDPPVRPGANTLTVTTGISNVTLGLASHPPRDVEGAAIIEGEDVLDAHRDVGPQVDERADARHVLVARAQRAPSEQTMVLQDEVRGEHRRELLPVPRRHGSLHAPPNSRAASA